MFDSLQFPAHDEILEIHHRAMEEGLEKRRNILFGGILNGFTSKLPRENNFHDQMLIDLFEMNRAPAVSGEVIPLERWLKNAAYQCRFQHASYEYFKQKAEKTASTDLGLSNFTVPLHITIRIGDLESQLS